MHGRQARGPNGSSARGRFRGGHLSGGHLSGGHLSSASPAPAGRTAAADGRAAAYPLRWWALAVADLCLLAITMDNTILNVALPTIARDLRATGSDLQWIVDAYIVVFAGLLLTSGTLGDRLGRRRLLLAGLVVFGAASAATVFVTNAAQLIVIRGAMGFGGALLMPATLSLITNIFPEDERPKAIATWAAVSGLGMVLGPITGGALLEWLPWNSIFLVNVPIALIGLVGALALMPESRDAKPGRTDPIGALLSIVALATLVFAIIEAPASGWTAPLTLARLAAGVALLGGFIAWERHYPDPMFDITLFARPAFGATSFAETVAHFALVGGTFGMTQYLQFVWGQRPLQAGVSMLPLAFGVIAGSLVAPRLQPRFGARRLIAAGMASIAASLFLVSRLDVGSSYLAFGAVLLVMSLGMGLAMAPATDSIMGAVDKDRAGVGSATNDTTRELGSALGVAVFGSIISTGYRDALVGSLAAIPGGAAALPPAVEAAVRDSIGSASVAAGQLPGGAAAPVLEAARTAFVSGMGTAAIVGAAAVAAGTLVLLHWLSPTERESAAAGSRDELPKVA